jgi:hypothetical protein
MRRARDRKRLDRRARLDRLKPSSRGPPRHRLPTVVVNRRGIGRSRLSTAQRIRSPLLWQTNRSSPTSPIASSRSP